MKWLRLATKRKNVGIHFCSSSNWGVGGLEDWQDRVTPTPVWKIIYPKSVQTTLRYRTLRILLHHTRKHQLLTFAIDPLLKFPTFQLDNWQSVSDAISICSAIPLNGYDVANIGIIFEYREKISIKIYSECIFPCF